MGGDRSAQTLHHNRKDQTMFTHKHAVAPNVDHIRKVDVDGNRITITLDDGTVVKHCPT